MSKDVKFKDNLALRKPHGLPPVATKDEQQQAPKGEQHEETSNSRSHLYVGRSQ